jgi:glycosyltransferase involved in cell wall biosynthesis
MRGEGAGERHVRLLRPWQEQNKNEMGRGMPSRRLPLAVRKNLAKIESMISVILSTRDDEMALAHALAALVPAAADGMVREVIVVDGGSKDDTIAVADAAGCRIVTGGGEKGADLAKGAALARSDWLLFLSPDVMLEPGWQREARDFIDRLTISGSGASRAAAFRLAHAGFGWRARATEVVAALRSRLFASPLPEQGLLVPASLYRAVGGHRAGARLAERDLGRRIGRGRLSFLRARAVSRGVVV